LAAGTKKAISVKTIAVAATLAEALNGQAKRRIGGGRIAGFLANGC
jgi:hypothetical protein